MGAIWKVRENLKNRYGADLGGAMANELFLGWMGGFSIGKIKSVIPYQFAILDSDGVISEAQNFSEINGAFLAHFFPNIQHPPVRQICN